MLDVAAVSAIFGCSIDFRSTSQDELIKHFEKVQAGQMTTARVQIYYICDQGYTVLSRTRTLSLRSAKLSPISQTGAVLLQVVVDYLKQYDKDGKGALSREELQEAMRGAV